MAKIIFKMKSSKFIYLLPPNRWKCLGNCHRHADGVRVRQMIKSWLKDSAQKTDQWHKVQLEPVTSSAPLHWHCSRQRRILQRSVRGKAKSCCWRGKTPGTRYRLWPDKQESSFPKKHLRVLVNNKFLSTLHWWGPTWSAVFTLGLPNHQRQGSTGVSPAKCW